MTPCRHNATHRWTGPTATAFAICAILALVAAGCTTDKGIIPPRCVNSPVLDYPPEAILERQSGALVVLLQVQQDGSTDSFQIQQSSGTAVLDQAGMEFVKRLEYLPAVIHGKRQSTRATQEVIFKLEKGPLDPSDWHDTTRYLINDLKRAAPDKQAVIEQRLYDQCADYLSAVITNPDLMMNRMAMTLVVQSVHEQWAPFENVFPLSFLMYADFAVRVQTPPLHEQARHQLRDSVAVDIHRLDQRLLKRDDPALLQLKASLVAYLVTLQ